MADEALVAGAWLQALLTTDDTLSGLVSGVYRGKAPQGKTSPYPYVIWDVQSGRDENAAAAPVQTEVIMQVKVVSDDGGDKTNVEAAVHRIDGMLTDARAVSQGVRIVVKRFGSVSYPESSDGVRWARHQGRLWQFLMGDS